MQHNFLLMTINDFLYDFCHIIVNATQTERKTPITSEIVKYHDRKKFTGNERKIFLLKV